MAKILVVGKYYPPCRGGTEANTQDVCKALAVKHSVTAHVFNHEPGSRSDSLDGVQVVRSNVTKTIKGQPISVQYWKNLSLDGVDLILFHAPNFFAAALLLFRLRWVGRTIPVIVTHHSDVHARVLLRRLLLPFYHRLVQRAVQVVVTSQKNADLSADIPIGARIAVVPLGIALDHYAISDMQRSKAQTWRRSLSADAPTIAFIGRHVRYKGLDILVQALARIPEAHAFIVGDGPFRRNAEILAVQLGIQARTHFLGNISEDEKLRVLASADVFAFPSTEVTEAFGIAQLEAMAAGVPVIASDLPTGVTDVAIDQVTALVVPPGDVEALAEGLRRLIGDKTFRSGLAQRATRRLQQEFSLPVTLNKFCDLVEETLRNRTALHS